MTEPYVCPQCGPDDRGGDVHTAMAHTVEGLLGGQTSTVQDRPEVAYDHDRVTVWAGDCLDVLRQLDGASVDAVVCDPPYGLEFMGKDWDRPWAVGMSAPGYADAERLERPAYGDNRNPTCDVCGGRARGANRCTCPEPTWKATSGPSTRPEPATRWAGLPFQRWTQAWATECLRVLKPGGHLLAFGGTRTYHRLTSGIEDAGFEVRDTIMWLYGQGFPKSLNVGMAIDKAAGADRPVVGSRTLTGTARIVGGQGGATSGRADELYATKELRDTLDLTGPATEDAKTWDGWGTALKPSHEPIVVARKPFTRTVADNVLTYGTGALNIDGTRSPMSDADAALIDGKHAGMDAATYERTPGASLRLSTDPMPLQPAKAHAAGRWPSNVILTHAQACTRTGTTTEVVGGGENGSSGFVDGYETGAGFVGREVTVDVWSCAPDCPVRALDEQNGATASRPFGGAGYTDTGGVSRYFTAAEWETGDPQLPTPGAYYVAKATTRERPAYAREDTDDAGRVAHPTVKPVALMRHLVRLVTPPGGTVLDPFAGSGTTGEAALLEGMRSVLIEREPDYLPLIAQRLDRHLDAAAWLRSTGQADGTLFG